MIMVWKSKSLSSESIKPPATADNSLNPKVNYFNNPKFGVEFDGNCLKPDKVTFTPNVIIRLSLYHGATGATLRNSLFGALRKCGSW